MSMIAVLAGSLAIVFPLLMLLRQGDRALIFNTALMLQALAVLVLLSCYEMAARAVIGWRVRQVDSLYPLESASAHLYAVFIAGEAVTGNIGSGRRLQYSISGNVVVLASRIEQLNKRYGSQFLASAEVMHAAGEPLAQAQRLGLVQVNGRDEAIALFLLA